MESDDLEKLQALYKEKFGEPFPFFLKTYELAMEQLEEALRTGIKHDEKLPDDVLI